MLKIEGTTITLTRGDSARIQLTLNKRYADGTVEPYTPAEGDTIRFAMKKEYSDELAPIIVNVPTDTMLLHIRPANTKNLPYGEYKYDVELTTASGDKDTFIEKATIILTEEVD